ncbi:hypothetical protein SISSUDRAFT_1059885 [Sistotremastrum suecicum HHB10207 ss-3]|uniref:Carbohydrate-binding module family 19 domain-containing protein n=1 Tax=Sistotremastrum suecicum HHB10207 ss-3 TaxID=1314776 RepID=A0A166FN36_9AGAM|nr:hypothetical protein SISSUDRAFT_1059885 [Sistotremastrum suecicum HHB10207 ss-3]
MFSASALLFHISVAALLVSAKAIDKRAEFSLSNGQAAQALNAKFATLAAGSPCDAGENACIDGQFSQCVNGVFVSTGCAGGLSCVALPLVNSAGTSITCDTIDDATTRIANTGATGGLTGSASKKRQATPTAPPACAAKTKRSFADLIFTKRIAQQDLPAVAQSWQTLCEASGGDIVTNTPCVTLAGVNGINALLANSDPCAQQDNADAMVTFAKSAGITNKDALIANAVAYRQHPRNALDIGGGLIPSTPFCQKAPQNAELNGLVNGQLDGVNPGIFGGPKFTPVAFGDPVSCPFGKTPDVSTCTCN